MGPNKILSLSNSRKVALAVLAASSVFSVVQKVSAGPITNPGAAPFTKVAAYQGLVTIVPAGGAAVMELGNAGTDIATSGTLYLRPGAMAQSALTNAQFLKNASNKTDLSLPGVAYVSSLCFGTVGSANCSNTWVGVATPTFDQVVAAGNTASAKHIALINQAGNEQSVGVTSGASVGSGSFAFLMARAAGNGSYSDVTRLNDSGLIFDTDTGLTIGGWNASGNIKGIRVSGSNIANGALTVNNGLAGTGSGGDALAIFSNTTNSALYAEQQSVNGYAGYFSSGLSGTTKSTIYAENNAGPANGIAEANALQVIGDVEIVQKGQTAPVWPNGSMLKIWGNVSIDNGSPDDGYLLDVRNADARGAAARFQGLSLFFSQDGLAGKQIGAIQAFGGNTPTATSSTWAVRGEAGVGSGTTYGGYFSGTSTGQTGYGVYTVGGNAGGSLTTYALYAKAGTGAGTNVAGFFEGGLYRRGPGAGAGGIVPVYVDSPAMTCSTACGNIGLTCLLKVNNTSGSGTEQGTGKCNNVSFLQTGCLCI